MQKKGVFKMKDQWKKEFLPSCLAGAVCGITALLALIFLAPGKWYFAFIVAVIMTGVSLCYALSEKKKLSARYERNENLIKNEYLVSAEGYIRTDSDSPAKFFFGENSVEVLSCKKVKPVLEEIPKDKIIGRGFDRCGWLSLLIEDEKRRIVFPAVEAEKILAFIENNGWGNKNQ